MEFTDKMKMMRTQADEYATKNGLDQWGTRVAWFVLAGDVPTARRMCAKYNKQSRAWECYTNLVNSGILVESYQASPEETPRSGLSYRKDPLWEEQPLTWFNAIADVAAGRERHPLL